MAKAFSILSLLGCLLLMACRQEGVEKLTIAAAANTQFAIEELTRSFTEETGIACETIISSSGKLTAQIREGAPFDIFISADMKYPNELYRNGHTTAAPEIYAYGRLVLWSLIDTIRPSVELLSTAEISHIALANPKTAPYGVAAVEVLKHYNIYENIESKLVYGESISQTNQFILSKAAGAGFTSLSVVLSPEMKGKGNWKELDIAAYSPIAQGAVILKSRKDYLVQAHKFYNFLFSEKGKRILDEFGYTVGNND